MHFFTEGSEEFFSFALQKFMEEKKSGQIIILM